MSPSPIVRAILVISGGVAIAIGGAILVAPAAFYAGYGIAWEGDPNLASELQGVAGLLLGSGLLIAAGAFMPRLTFTAAVLTSVLCDGPGRVAGCSRHAVDGDRAVGRGRAVAGSGGRVRFEPHPAKERVNRAILARSNFPRELQFAEETTRSGQVVTSYFAPGLPISSTTRLS